MGSSMRPGAAVLLVACLALAGCDSEEGPAQAVLDFCAEMAELPAEFDVVDPANPAAPAAYAAHAAIEPPSPIAGEWETVSTYFSAVGQAVEEVGEDADELTLIEAIEGAVEESSVTDAQLRDALAGVNAYVSDTCGLAE